MSVIERQIEGSYKIVYHYIDSPFEALINYNVKIKTSLMLFILTGFRQREVARLE